MASLTTLNFTTIRAGFRGLNRSGKLLFSGRFSHRKSRAFNRRERGDRKKDQRTSVQGNRRTWAVFFAVFAPFTVKGFGPNIARRIKAAAGLNCCFRSS
jgi:hypothetical protein